MKFGNECLNRYKRLLETFRGFRLPLPLTKGLTAIMSTSCALYGTLYTHCMFNLGRKGRR